MAEISTIDLYVYGKQDDPALRQELINIVKGTGIAGTGVNPAGFACRPEQKEMLAFFENPQNISEIKAAKERYGMPAKNREATKSSRLFGRWTDYCDWFEVYRFYYYAKLSKDYPKFNPNDQSICYLIDGYIESLNAEKVIIEKDYTLHGDMEKYKLELEAFNDKLTEYNLLKTNLKCEQYVKEVEEIKNKLETEEQLKKRLELQQESLKETIKSTSGVSGGGTKLAIYVFGGVAALIGIMFLTRKNA